MIRHHFLLKYEGVDLWNSSSDLTILYLHFNMIDVGLLTLTFRRELQMSRFYEHAPYGSHYY